MKLPFKLTTYYLLRYLVLFVVFSSIFYFENEKIGSVKFSQLWKIPLVLAIMVYLLVSVARKNVGFVKVFYLFALKNLLNLGLIENFVNNVIIAAKFLNLPLLLHLFTRIFKTPSSARLVLIRVAQYFILSGIPFHLGLVDSYVEGLEFGDKFSFIGLFQNPHGASSATALSVLVVLFYLKNAKLPRLAWWYNVFLISVGVYSVYLAFVRTGYAMLILGSIAVLWPRRLTVKQASRAIVVALVGVSAAVLLVQSNEAFRARILDLSESGEKRDLGSGRLKFAQYSIDFWADGDVVELLIGRGQDAVMENLKATTGMRIFSHNGFVDSLAANGLVGLALHILMIYYFYRLVAESKNMASYRLGIAMFVSFVSYQATQGGAGFPTDLILALSLSILILERGAALRNGPDFRCVPQEKL